MHGLVSQRAVPSPHTEYLGITYFEDSNADRSSALGLRLNQQNKMKKNKNIPCDINNATCATCKKCSDRPEIVTSEFICLFLCLGNGSLQLPALQVPAVAEGPAHWSSCKNETTPGAHMSKWRAG